MVEQQATVA